MTDWHRKAEVKTIVQYIVKAAEHGVAWDQLQEALNAAIRDYNSSLHGAEPASEILVHASDAAIVIEFEKPRPSGLAGLKRRVGAVGQLRVDTKEGDAEGDADRKAEVIDQKADTYIRLTAPTAAEASPDDPAYLTQGGVASLMRDAYRAGAAGATTPVSRGASRYDNAGVDRQTYEDPACGVFAPHDPHMHTLIGGLTLNCPGYGHRVPRKEGGRWL